MKLDLIKAVVLEMSELLTGSRISKIHQPAPEILVFRLWNGKETLRLLLSAEVQKSRLHLTEKTWPNPHIPPRFCQLLRARISRIISISVVNDDRIVQFECAGNHGNCCLIAELTGTSSNLILVDDQGVIIDVLKRIRVEAGKRALLAGKKYVLPEKNSAVRTPDSQTQKIAGSKESASQSVENLFSDDKYADNKKDFRGQLLQTIGKQLKKIQKRIVSIENELKKQKEWDRYRQIGDLLLANLHSVSTGLDTITLLNYYLQPPEPVVIDLDPTLKPHQNVDRYFKKYKKAKRGFVHGQRRLLETRVELEWLDQLDYQLKDLTTNADTEEIAQELRHAGLLLDKNRLHTKRTLQPSKPHEATSPSGFKIIWGRNNRQNDEISLKRLKSGDLWFHAKQVPGAHVVLKLNQAQPKVADIEYAAAVAAGYSKAKNDNTVEVMQATAKDIRKPKGGRAGIVNVLHYRTVLVKPLRLD